MSCVLPIIIFINCLITIYLMSPVAFSYNYSWKVLFTASIFISIIEFMKMLSLVVLTVGAIVLLFLVTMQINLRSQDEITKARKRRNLNIDTNVHSNATATVDTSPISTYPTTSSFTLLQNKRITRNNDDKKSATIRNEEEIFNNAFDFIEEDISANDSHHHDFLYNVASDLLNKNNVTNNEMNKEYEEVDLEDPLTRTVDDSCFYLDAMLRPVLPYFERRLRRNLFCTVVFTLLILISLFIFASVLLSAMIFQISDWLINGFEVYSFVYSVKAAVLMFISNAIFISLACLFAKIAGDQIFEAAKQMKNEPLCCLWWWLGYSTVHQKELDHIELFEGFPTNKLILCKPENDQDEDEDDNISDSF